MRRVLTVVLMVLAVGLLPVPAHAAVAGCPSAVINLQNWYLTLPTGSAGNPTTVRWPQLDDCTRSPLYGARSYFQRTADNGVLFRAPVNGVTTSGSSYPRSELREMKGTSPASWDGRRGVHTMTVRQKITETPLVKAEVVAGQIHGTSDDLMQIHLSGTRLRVKYADGAKSVDLDTAYRLGTVFDVRIESRGNPDGRSGRVKVWYNNVLRADLPIWSSTSYFKAGSYPQSNLSKGDKATAGGTVVIYGLTVTHQP